MTTIKASCPSCGEVALTSDDIVLRLGPEAAGGTYSFDCPDCGETIEKPASERVVKLLLSGGVVPRIVDVPAEALEDHIGDPINYDDLLAFHELMSTDDWFERLAQ